MKNELYPFPFPPDLFVRDPANQPFPIPSLNVVYLRRNFLGRVVNVGITPTLIHHAIYPQNLMIQNPNVGVGGGGLPTASGLHTSQVGANAAGNTQAASLGVANYLNMELFLRITAITGTWSFYNQDLDPGSLLWADSQVLAGSVNAAMVATWTNSIFYANLGTFGVGSQYAVRWNPDAAGAITFTLGYVLKSSLVGSSLGASQTVYIGSNNGVSITSGYPIPGNWEKVFQVGEGIEVWGIAAVATNINVLEL